MPAWSHIMMSDDARFEFAVGQAVQSGPVANRAMGFKALPSARKTGQRKKAGPGKTRMWRQGYIA
jgi:hypothetical protein